MSNFMDYVVHAFNESTDWNPDNSYSSLTATSDALLSFQTPTSLALHVSSLSTPNFATSYTLSTLGHIDGSISYLYTTVPLGHIPSQTHSIPLRDLVRGYKDVRLPRVIAESETTSYKPTLLHATLALPPPSILSALYARRINYNTLLSVSLYSKSSTLPGTSGPPPASVLAHLQHDTGQYSIEGLGSTDSALLGVRGLWNFGLSPPKENHVTIVENSVLANTEESHDQIILPPPPSPSPEETLAAYKARLASKPSLLSAGAEFYYSPFSHVIGLSTGLRFTTLAPHITPTTVSVSRNKPLIGTSAALSTSLLAPSNVSHSSFPYTMTLTLTPLTGSIASTYSVRPTPNLSLSSRCDFNFYSWESQYVVGAEIWRNRRRQDDSDDNPTAWARRLTADWFSSEERALKDARAERDEENVVKLRIDDGWNFKALWSGRVKALLITAGVSVNPVAKPGLAFRSPGMDTDRLKKWSGSVGVSVAYST